MTTELIGAELAHTYGRTTPVLPFKGVEITDEMVRRAAERLVLQLLVESLPDHWIRRAVELERVGTFDASMKAIACRRHAWLLATEGPAAEELVDLATEVSTWA